MQIFVLQLFPFLSLLPPSLSLSRSDLYKYIDTHTLSYTHIDAAVCVTAAGTTDILEADVTLSRSALVQLIVGVCARACM